MTRAMRRGRSNGTRRSAASPVIVWRQAVYDQMSYARLVDAFEELARQDDPFAIYPIIRIWPKH